MVMDGVCVVVVWGGVLGMGLVYLVNNVLNVSNSSKNIQRLLTLY